ncbi:MAG TPA: ABC transporter permease [Thermoanaerobaculia bacterium]|nr:ABC transporter permease [Thermoanaerobaculia bacterium]
MSTPSNGVRELPMDPQNIVPAAMAETQPMYWSVRRELWENRFLYIAPLIVNAFVLFGSFISVITLAHKGASVLKPFQMAPAPVMLTCFLVGIFYSLDALYGERRDRSILFWKSLPVSDLTTVLSKAAIPLAVLPLIALSISVATQYILLLLSTPVLLGNGLSPARLWADLHFFEGLVVMFYGLAVHALWFAPVYGWLLLISAWARRAPFLWALLPLLAVAAVERIVFNTWSFMTLLQYRVIGAMATAFARPKMGGDGSIDRLAQLAPVKFLSTPGLWAGLAFAAISIAAAVRLRRYREPI